MNENLGASSVRFVSPMKALGVAKPPAGVWSCEIKFDGYRAIAVLNKGRAELWSRNRKPLSGDFPAILDALGKLKCRSATLDGELVALDPAGRSRFQLLQARGSPAAQTLIVYYVFDLLQFDGKSLVTKPLEQRRERLASLVGKRAGALQISPSFLVEPAVLLAAAREKGLEGIIAKRPGSLYEADRRSGAWVKCKVVDEQEFVIGGFTQPKNSREYFGAILVGYYRGGKFLYAGKVGTGFDATLLRTLHEKFIKRTQAGCPFANLPIEKRSRFGAGMTRAAMKEVTWLKPSLIAQVKFAEWTSDALLRQPVFLGLRADKRAKAVHREATLA